MRRALAVVSLVTALITGWLTVMYVLLHHQGWAWHAAMAAALVAHCVLSIVVAEDVLSGPWAERIVILGACYAIWFAWTAISIMLASSHFEGFWLPVGCALVVQAGLTLAAFARPRLLNTA